MSSIELELGYCLIAGPTRNGVTPLSVFFLTLSSTVFVNFFYHQGVAPPRALFRRYLAQGRLAQEQQVRAGV